MSLLSYKIRLQKDCSLSLEKLEWIQFFNFGTHIVGEDYFWHRIDTDVEAFGNFYRMKFLFVSINYRLNTFIICNVNFLFFLN